MAPRPVHGTPESLAETVLLEIREDVRALAGDVRTMDSTLRGEGGRNGMVAKVNALWQHHQEQQELRRLKIVPKGERGSVLTDPKVWAIWGGVAAGFLSLAADLFRYLTGG